MARKLTRGEIADFLTRSVSDPWIAAALRRGDALSEADVAFVRDVLEISRPVFGAAAAPADDDIDPARRDAELAGLAEPWRAIAAAAVGTTGLAAGMRAAYRATAAVVDVAAGGHGLLGTAFLAADNPPRLMTAGHIVTALPRPLGLVFAGSVPDPVPAATVVAVTDSWRHPVLDIGILTIDPSDLPANLVPLVPAARATGPQLVVAVGYPGSPGNFGRFSGHEGTRCFCLGLMDPDLPGGPWQKLLVGSADRQPVAGHDCSTEGGFSGGPVIDASTGALVAVHVHGAKLLGTNQRNLAIPATLVFSDGELLAKLGAPAPLVPTAAAPGRRQPRAALMTARSIKAGGVGRLLSAQEDWPDIRDRVYAAGLHGLGSQLVPDPLNPAAVLDQGTDPSCVGFALAATVDGQLRARNGRAAGVSPRLLYELARVHDEMPGEAYRGTTLRGGIKAFFHNGAGPLAPARETAPRLGARDFILDDATAVQAGSYFRLRRDIDDFHSALAELGSVLVSARIHQGWTAPESTGGRIVPSRVYVGAHAFSVVGYDDEGFLVQNSWGADWGQWRGPDRKVRPGVAHWTYEDFDDALIDAWVVRIAVSTPRFNRRLLAARRGETGAAGDGPRRNDLAGRLLVLADDDLAGGKYAFDGSWLDAARRRVRAARTGLPRGRHLVLAFHDGFADAERIATRALALDAAVAGRAVAFSVAWRPALAMALAPCAAAVPDSEAMEDAEARDRRTVRAVAPVAASLWRAATSDAAAAFADGRPARVLGAVLAPAQGSGGLTLHVLADGLGALAMAAWLNALAARQPGRWRIHNLLLFAPCLPIELWRTAFEPRLAGLLADLPIRQVRQWDCDPGRTSTDRTGRYRGAPSRLLSAALGTADLGNPATLSALGMLPEHRIVEANALSTDFLDRRDILISVSGFMTPVR